jgi:pimeloyl-ACP methyl ester carboxylesterase
MVLLHGGRDHARNWDWVALALREEYHIIAPDLRGHGDSEWARGGQYAMIDYVLDVAQLLEQLQLFPITLIGHSLGGAIACQYSGVYPERVKQLVAIEGLGPPPDQVRSGPAYQRMRQWITQMRALAGRHPRRYSSLEEAVQRMQEANKHLSAGQARHLTVHGTYRNEDGTYTWKFDNYVRSQSPYEFNIEEARSMWRRITCPTLLLRGTESWATDPRQDGRAGAFANARCVDIAQAGHWVHHDQLDEFLRVVRDFLKETA